MAYKLNSALPYEDWELLHNAVFSGEPRLQEIHDYARAHSVAPIALLCVVLTRIAAASHPVTVNAGLGETPLNLYLALVGDSGAGKDTVLNRAEKALPLTRSEFPITPAERPLGSGESLITAFNPVAAGNDDMPPIPETRVLFTETEISNAGVLMRREGSTLRSNLLKLYSGSTAGSATKSETTTVQAGSYSCGLVVGVQRGTVGVLLDNPDDGLPHRFLWTELVDPLRPDGTQPDRSLSSCKLPPPGTVIHACKEARDETTAKRDIALQFGITGGLDSHHNLTRIRVAALLAILRGDAEKGFTLDDWSRANLIVTYSQIVRTSCEQYLRERTEVARIEHEQTITNVRRAKARTSVYEALKDLKGNEAVNRSPLTNRNRRYREETAEVIDDLLAAGILKIQQGDEEGKYLQRGENWGEFASSFS